MSSHMDKAGSAREDVAVQGSGRSPMGTERVRGEDTLSVIGHDDDWTPPTGPWTEADHWHWTASHHREFRVIAERERAELLQQLEGAVRVRNHFREALRVIAANEHGDPADRNLARAALAHPGGGQ